MYQKTKKAALSLVLVVSIAATMLPAAAAEEPVYSDIGTHWAKESIEAWSANNVLKGYAGAFRPDDAVTRGEMAVILDRLMLYPVKASNTFLDLDNSFYTDAILGASKAGVIKGDAGLVRPGDPITREEAAVMMGRAFGIQESSSTSVFQDAVAISSWAKGYVAAMNQAGYLNGSFGYFNPKSNITRAETVTIIDNMIKEFVNASGVVSEDVTGNLLLHKTGTTLKDMTVSGDVIIGDGVGEGDVTLDGVTVKGNLVVRGGGVNSIHIIGTSRVGNMPVCKPTGGVRIVIAKEASVKNLTVLPGSTAVTLNGNVDHVAVNASGAALSLASAAVSDITLNASEIALSVDRQSAVSTVTVNGEKAKISGNGKITAVKANADNTTVTVPGATVTAASGVTGTKAGDKTIAGGESGKVTSSSSGSSGGGSDDSSSIDYRTSSKLGAAITDTVDLGSITGVPVDKMKLNYSVNGTKITASGSLVFVSDAENMDNLFPEGEQDGYFATLRIPVDKADAEKALADTTKGVVAELNGKKFMGKADYVEPEENLKRNIENFITKVGENYYIDLLLRVADADGKLSSFSLKVDWDGSRNTNQSGVYLPSTYTIDFSGVTLLPDGFTVPQAGLLSVDEFPSVANADQDIIAYGGVAIEGNTIKLSGTAPYKTGFTSMFEGDEANGNFVAFELNYGAVASDQVKAADFVLNGKTSHNCAQVTESTGKVGFILRVSDTAFQPTIDVKNGDDTIVTYTIDLSGLKLVSEKAVTTSEQLTAALANSELTEIEVYGVIGAEDAYGSYKVDRKVTIKAIDDAKVFGSFIVTADEVSFDGLTIANKGGSDEHKNAINGYCSAITIQNCTFEASASSANGVVLFPASETVSYTITGNTFNGYHVMDGDYSAAGLIITSGYDMANKPFFGVEGISAETDMAAQKDLAIITGNTFTNCQNDYTRNSYADAPSGKIYATANSGSDNFRLAYAADTANFYVTGNVTRASDTTIKSGSTLTVLEGCTLTIDSGATLTVEGEFVVKGALAGEGSVVTADDGHITGADQVLKPAIRWAI